tara:strand:+ start:23 stop:250 length:228 start_codon:yes stop_codon:yes gene_type:complete
MDELMDMIGADESASQITDKIKDLLYAKSAEKVELARPEVASSLFGDQEVEIDDDEEYETEAELEVEEPEEESEE